jgi:hypothetical protein
VSQKRKTAADARGRGVLISPVFLEVPDIGRNELSNNRAMNRACAIGTAPW